MPACLEEDDPKVVAVAKHGMVPKSGGGAQCLRRASSTVEIPWGAGATPLMCIKRPP